MINNYEVEFQMSVAIASDRPAQSTGAAIRQGTLTTETLCLWERPEVSLSKIMHQDHLAEITLEVIR